MEFRQLLPEPGDGRAGGAARRADVAARARPRASVHARELRRERRRPRDRSVGALAASATTATGRCSTACASRSTRCSSAPARCEPSATAGSSASPSAASAGCERGLRPEPIACIVTRSGEVPLDIPLFAGARGAKVVIFAPVELDDEGCAADVDVVRARPRRAHADDRHAAAARRLRRAFAPVRGRSDAVWRAAAGGRRRRAVPDVRAEARRRRARPDDQLRPGACRAVATCRSSGCSNATARCTSATESLDHSSFDLRNLGNATMTLMGASIAAPTGLTAAEAVEALRRGARADARARRVGLRGGSRARALDADEPARLGSRPHRRVRGPVARAPLRRQAAAAGMTSPTSTTRSRRPAPVAATSRSSDRPRPVRTSRRCAPARSK